MTSTRRQFLVGGLQVTVAFPLFSRLDTSRHAGDDSDRVLVVLQLTGGNDGLNTLVPAEQDTYWRVRPTLALPRGDLHLLDDGWGLHPRMGALAELFGEGKLACQQSVGYPQASRSHFRSMEIWHTADPLNPPDGLGWLGRMADRFSASRSGSMPALHIGSGNLPLALGGRVFRAPSVRDLEGFRARDPLPRFGSWRSELLGGDKGGDDLEFLRESAAGAYRAAERMSALAQRNSPVSYPGTRLARELALVARLISGGFGTRLFHVSLDGFDTHARQAPTHAGLLGELAEALRAFQRDLEHDGADRRVVVLVFSEFGRRVAENGSKGTDHGKGAPVFLVGTPVRGGLHGRSPDLEHLDEGDVVHGTDFRSVYATLERNWMGLAAGTTLPPLDLLA